MNIDEPMDTQVTEFSDSEVPSLLFSESLIGTPKAHKVGELTALLKVKKKSIQVPIIKIFLLKTIAIDTSY